MTRILITGAGLVGAHAARALMDEGGDVVLLDSAPNAAYVRRIVGQDVPIERIDVRELPALVDAISRFAPDVVVHTVALIGGAAQTNPYAGVQVNVGGTVNVAEAVRLLGVRRLVHASTLGVNDLSQPQTGPIDEHFPIGSRGRIYSATKVACEELLRAYRLAYGFELAMLRFAGIYGDGHFAGGSGIGQEIVGVLDAAREGRPATIGAGMPATYEVVYAKDVANGVVRAATVPTLEHDVYNIGTGVVVTPEDVIDAVGRIYPGFVGARGPESRPDPYPKTQAFDLTRSRSELGYEPRYDLEAGLRDLAGDLAARRV